MQDYSWSLVHALVLLGCAGAPDPKTADQSPDYDPRAVTRCEHGADDGQQAYTVETWRACFYAARAYADNPPASLRYAQRSCDMGYDAGCILYLDFVRATATRGDDAARDHIARARDLGKKFCEQGLEDFVGHDPRTGEACHLAGQLFADVAPKDAATAQALWKRGCEKGDEGSCLLGRGQ